MFLHAEIINVVAKLLHITSPWHPLCIFNYHILNRGAEIRLLRAQDSYLPLDKTKFQCAGFFFIAAGTDKKCAQMETAILN
jgi:hypothetical protein